MRIINATDFNDTKLTKFGKKIEPTKKREKHLKKKHNFDSNLNQHSRNRICVLQKKERKINYIVENYIHNKHLIKRESHRTAASASASPPGNKKNKTKFIWHIELVSTQ